MSCEPHIYKVLFVRGAGAGYRRTGAAHDAADACEDVDECSERPDRCAPGVCINTDGGYSCDCDAGYEPNDDGTECIGEYLPPVTY